MFGGLSRYKLRDFPALLGKWFGGVIYLVIAVILIAFGAIHIVAGFMPDLVSADYMLPEIIKRALSEAEGANPGERGDYYNFLIGVPLAAAGSAVAAVVAASARSVANRQRTVQEMDLIDRKITGEARTFLKLVNAFDDIHEQGERLHREFLEFLDECDDRRVHVLSVINGYDTPHDTWQVSGEDVDDMRARWPDQLMAHVELVKERVCDVFEGFQVLTFDPFWAAAMDMQGEQTQRDWYDLENVMRTELTRPEPRSGKSPRYLARELRQWTQAASLDYALMAFLYTPEDCGPVEFVGGMFQLVDEKFRFPGDAIDEAWENKSTKPITIYNVGAAKLYSLYRALPSQKALEATVYSLFPMLDSFESRSYFQTLPDKRRITNDAFLDALDKAFDTPRSLIYKQGVTRAELDLWPTRIASGKKPRGRDAGHAAPGAAPSKPGVSFAADPALRAALTSRMRQQGEA